MHTPNDNPVFQEDYYAPITSRIAPILSTVERSPATAFIVGLLLAIGCFLIGWHARGLWEPVWDNRGWAALLLFAVIGAALAVRRSEVH